MSLSASESWPALQHTAKWSRSQTLASAVLAVLGLLVLLGVLLVVRRLGGAFTADLPRSALLLTAVVSTAIAGSARVVWRQIFPHQFETGYSFSWGDQLVGWGSSLALVMIMVGCSFPGEKLSDWLIWLPLLVIDLFWRQDFFDDGHPEYQAGLYLDDVVETEIDLLDSQSVGAATNSLEQPECTQQIFRVREADGQEAIYATLQSEFQAGQRYATAYVGFCPPLPFRPAIEVDQTGGPAADIKIVQTLSHGARFDLKLAIAAECSTQVTIDLAARSPKSTGS
ncbi:hypothetical protein [Bythopirellula polymerisocia]|uniref:Uncharacterized protein n=1 Tax=Bythopirellula polymerisocia TaxID=2528003 RepID=A0A5C6CDW5_9BACT|nr:hypothetical protein [Bythopirellula polymerisocia]TWU21947.1 hypothetical protein Pla144_44140 [Bythopirellula polymerisocia]